MTKKDMILEEHGEHPCQNANEIKGFIYRKFNELYSAQSISGVLRSSYAQGKIGKSNATGKTVYWIIEEVQKL